MFVTHFQSVLENLNLTIFCCRNVLRIKSQFYSHWSNNQPKLSLLHKILFLWNSVFITCVMHVGHTYNFNKAPPEITHAFGVGYDYDSVMHYSSTAFSKNYQLKTIVPKVGNSYKHCHIYCLCQCFIINYITWIVWLMDGAYADKNYWICQFNKKENTFCEFANHENYVVLYIIYVSICFYVSVETIERWNIGYYWRNIPRK